MPSNSGIIVDMQKSLRTYIHFEDLETAEYKPCTADEARDAFFAIEEICNSDGKGLKMKNDWDGPHFVLNPSYEAPVYADDAYHIYLMMDPTPADVKE